MSNVRPDPISFQRGYVMESGAITLSGAASELLGSDAVQRAYLGG